MFHNFFLKVKKIIKGFIFDYTINGKYLIISMSIKMFKMNRKSSLDCQDEGKAANM